MELYIRHLGINSKRKTSELYKVMAAPVVVKPGHKQDLMSSRKNPIFWDTFWRSTFGCKYIDRKWNSNARQESNILSLTTAIKEMIKWWNYLVWMAPVRFPLAALRYVYVDREKKTVCWNLSLNTYISQYVIFFTVCILK